MKRTIIIALICLLLAPSLGMTDVFNCENPPFGEEIKKYKGFVKYRKAGRVEYYNYTGETPCHQDLSPLAKPAIAYAVVDGKLYAQIESSRISKRHVKVAKAQFEKYFAGKIKFEELAPFWEQVQKRLNTKADPKVKKRDRNNYEMIWNFEDKNLRVKLKLNFAAARANLNYYYLPIWKELQN